MKTLASVAAVLAALTVAGPAGAADATRTQRISATGDLIPQDRQLRGTASVRVPRAWESRNRTSVPRTALLTARPAAGCEVAISISTRGVASSATTPRQVSLAVGDDLTTRGSRAHGSWGMGANDTEMFATGVVHLTERKYLQIRAFARLGAGCDPAVLTTGALPAAFRRIAQDGVVDAKVVPRRR
jgi:hypothetical protein